MTHYGDVTQQQKIDALGMFVEDPDVTPLEVARRLELTAPQVEEIQKRHGYPDPARMRLSADMMGKALVVQQEQAERPRPTPRGSAPRPSPRLPEPGTRPPAASLEPSVTDRIGRAIATARGSGDARLKRLADKAEDARDALLNGVGEWEQAAEQRRLEAEAAAKREREIAELEEKLTALRGQRQASAALGKRAKSIRAWAAANGVECPARGRVPMAVVEAYEKAQTVA